MNDDVLSTEIKQLFNKWSAEVVRNAELRMAIQKIADLADSEADEPLDDAIRIARTALQ